MTNTLIYKGKDFLETSDGRFEMVKDAGRWALTDTHTGKTYTNMRDHLMAEAWIEVILEDESEG